MRAASASLASWLAVLAEPAAAASEPAAETLLAELADPESYLLQQQ